MSASPEFADHVRDLLRPVGDIQVRRMFGGYGIYGDGVMFALIADDVLYFKVDAVNAPAFAARGLPPFKPFPDKPTVMPYRMAPDDALEDPESLLPWARSALDAALRTRKKRR